VEQALRYLTSLGHRRIAFCRPLAGPLSHPRETHFHDFIERSPELKGDWLFDVVGKSDVEIQDTLREALEARDAPTACVAGNDNAALMLMTNLAALNVPVPAAFSVVGFDNLRYVQHLPVPLTTIDQPKQEMGRRAAELFFDRIQAGPGLPFRNQVFTPHLVIRESCSVAPVSPPTKTRRPVLAGSQA
jgi:DNA-binding LacI/PurR family transcriptional regulator